MARSDAVQYVSPDGKSQRRFYLPPDKLLQKMELWHQTGRFPSPYSRGVYTDQLEALVDLGVNRPWGVVRIIRQMEKRMSAEVDASGQDRWSRFQGKKSNSPSPKDEVGRVIDNFRLMRRLCRKGGGQTPYGAKLAQMGACVDHFLVDGVPYFRLNTYSKVPLVIRDLSSVVEIPPVSMSRRTLGPKP